MNKHYLTTRGFVNKKEFQTHGAKRQKISCSEKPWRERKLNKLKMSMEMFE